jgi:predicted Zn-dependent protease
LSLGLLVDQLVSENRITEAIHASQRLAQVQPENTNHFSNLAGLAYRAGDRQLAISSLQAGLQHHPEAIGLQIPIARLYLELGQPIQAREMAQKILSQKQIAEAWSILAASYEATGERDKATQAHLEAQKIGRGPIKN